MSLLVRWKFQSVDGRTRPIAWVIDSGVGVIGTAIAISIALAGVTVTSYFIKLPGTTLFWLAFLLLRPLGVSLGDALTKPPIQMGLQLGSAAASVGLAVVLSFIVMFGEDRRGRITFKSQTKPGSAS